MNVVITSMRNEDPYILEWVAWNIFIGFDKVIIFTNHNTDNSVSTLNRLAKAGYVEFYELEPPESAKPQMYAFKEALKWAHKNKPDWISCIDVDEYIFLKKNNNITDYINSFPKETDAIAINWKIFGSGHINKKGHGFTIERFLMRANDNYRQHYQFKSLFRYKPTLKRFHHKVFYDEKCIYAYSDGKLLSNNAKNPGFDLSSSDNYISFSSAQINHYTIRSHQEFIEKMSRGNGLDPAKTENTRHIQYLKKFDKNDIYEVEILDMLDKYSKLYEKIKNESNL